MPSLIITAIRLISLESVHGAPRAYGSVRGLVDRRSANLVLVDTDAGVTGLGEAWGPAALLPGALAVLRPHYIGQPVHDARRVWHRLAASLYHFGLHHALTWMVSGIDIALHDLAGKLAGVPVCQLLGGAVRTEVPVYASGGYFSADPDNTLQAQLEALQGRGFRALKIKIGASPADDARRCALARHHCPGAGLIVDANGNYTVEQALDSMARVQGDDLLWYEEPLAPADLEGYRSLYARKPLVVSAGEAHYTAFEFDRLLAPRCIDIAQPDVTKGGGLTQARLVADLCWLRHAHLSAHAWGGAVGLAAALHLMAAQPAYPHHQHLPLQPWLEYDVSPNPLRESLLRPALQPRDGYLAVPMGPGLGIELDPDAVERHRVRDVGA